MKRIVLYIPFVAVLCAMTACSKGKPSEAQELSMGEKYPGLYLRQTLWNRLEAIDTIVKIPEELTESEKIVYLENLLITHPVTVEELLALEPVSTLDPDTARYGEYWKPEEWSKESREKTQLANRFMRMHFVSMGDPDDEMQWTLAVDTMLGEYALSHGITNAQAIEHISEGVTHLEAGTQYEINIWCYVQAAIEYYKTLSAYHQFIENQIGSFQQLYYDEYKAWSRMNRARHEAYVCIRRAGDHYSALPMEYEAMYAAYAVYRRQILEKENEILYGEDYQCRHPLVSAKDWEDYLDYKLFRSADDEDSVIVNEVDQSVREWLTMRQRIAKNAFSFVQESYANLTSDYYWVIVNEAEPMPDIY